MISKELLNNILEENITYLEFKGDRLIQSGLKNSEFVYVGLKKERKKINIYELAHKCKEWASSKGYVLTSSFNNNRRINKGSCLVNNCSIGKICNQSEPLFDEKTEPEAIFKACEWILKEIK